MLVDETVMINGTQTVLSYFDYEVLRIAQSAAFFPISLVSLVENIFIGLIVSPRGLKFFARRCLHFE